MKHFDFYQDLDLRYPELAICIENAVDKVAKFIIPILTPMLDHDKPYETTDINISTNNILNDSSSMEIGACTSSNYLELVVPENLGECKKGDIFVVIFIGGDPNKPVLLGRYYNAINR